MIRKEKIEQDQLDAPMVVGMVGHIPVEQLAELKRYLRDLEGFRLVFFKTSTGRLYIKEGD